MELTKPVQGVYLSETIDLKTYYAAAFAPFADTLRLLDPAEIADPNEIDFALCWEPADDAFASYPGLRLISSIAAGVDTILRCSSLPDHVPVMRIRDPQQARDMAAFAIRYVVDAHRDMARYAKQQEEQTWQRNAYGPTSKFRISILGYGLMGKAVSDGLSRLGYDVVAFARNPREESSQIEVFSAADGKLAAVSGADLVINHLPATADTVGLLDMSVFAAMAGGATLVNLGRGQHLVEDDLLRALDSGQLHHAALDVAAVEPIPTGHAFWTHPRISITPHIAAESIKDNVARLVSEDIRRVWAGQSPVGLIDRARAY
ncbi:MAG: NAD(P)-dependent oxidoreductase [Pseudomonadota bacterium]